MDRLLMVMCKLRGKGTRSLVPRPRALTKAIKTKGRVMPKIVGRREVKTKASRRETRMLARVETKDRMIRPTPLPTNPMMGRLVGT